MPRPVARWAFISQTPVTRKHCYMDALPLDGRQRPEVRKHDKTAPKRGPKSPVLRFKIRMDMFIFAPSNRQGKDALPTIQALRRDAAGQGRNRGRAAERPRRRAGLQAGGQAGPRPSGRVAKRVARRQAGRPANRPAGRPSGRLDGQASGQAAGRPNDQAITRTDLGPN